jgi:cadmium resistance protein CadD (predicted permease)
MDRQSRMRKLFNSLTVLESVPTFLAHKVDVLAIANIFFLFKKKKKKRKEKRRRLGYYIYIYIYSNIFTMCKL